MTSEGPLVRGVPRCSGRDVLGYRVVRSGLSLLPVKTNEIENEVDVVDVVATVVVVVVSKVVVVVIEVVVVVKVVFVVVRVVVVAVVMVVESPVALLKAKGEIAPKIFSHGVSRRYPVIVLRSTTYGLSTSWIATNTA